MHQIYITLSFTKIYYKIILQKIFTKNIFNYNNKFLKNHILVIRIKLKLEIWK